MKFLVNFKKNLFKKNNYIHNYLKKKEIYNPSEKVKRILKDLELPTYDAPNESQTIKLVEENFGNQNYNLLFFN